MVSRRRRSNRPRRILVFWVGWWVAGMVLWLMLTSTIDPSEALVGAGAAAVAATAAEVVRSKQAIAFRPRWRWLVRARRIPWQVLADTVVVAAALWRHASGRKRVRGTWRAVPFRFGGSEDPGDAARRALATIGVSMTPNTVVVGVDPQRNELLVHQLVASPGELRRLVGGP